MASLGTIQMAQLLTPEELAQLQAGGDPQQQMLNQTVPMEPMPIDTSDVMAAQQIGLDSYLTPPSPASPLEEMMLADQQEKNPQVYSPQSAPNPMQQEMLAKAQAAADASTQAEQAGITGLEDYINQYKSKPTGVDLSALGGLLSSLDPRFQSLSQSLEKSRPETESAKAEKLAGLMQKLQASKSQASKGLLSTLNAQLKAMDTGNVLKQKFDMRQNAIDESNKQKVLNRLNNNIGLRNEMSSQMGLRSAFAVLENADEITPQILHDFQQILATNMGVRGQSGVAERGERYFNTAGLDWAKWKQYVLGNPEDLGKDNAIIEHLRKMGTVEKDLLGKRIDKHLNALAAGNKSMFQRRPDLKEDVMESIAAQKEYATGVDAAADVPRRTMPGLPSAPSVPIPSIPSASGVPSEAELDAKDGAKEFGGKKAGMAAGVSNVKAAAGKVTVTNGKETIALDNPTAADLADAKKEGFEVMK